MITIKRGTTNEFVIALVDETGAEYKLEKDDTLILGVKESSLQKDYILSKKITDYNAEQGGYLVVITPEDTEKLSFGSYVYDVGLQKAEGEFHIVCPKDGFIIEETVTKRVE